MNDDDGDKNAGIRRLEVSLFPPSSSSSTFFHSFFSLFTMRRLCVSVYADVCVKIEEAIRYPVGCC